jgi:hypothetical protein
MAEKNPPMPPSYAGCYIEPALAPFNIRCKKCGHFVAAHEHPVPTKCPFDDNIGHHFPEWQEVVTGHEAWLVRALIRTNELLEALGRQQARHVPQYDRPIGEPRAVNYVEPIAELLAIEIVQTVNELWPSHRYANATELTAFILEKLHRARGYEQDRGLDGC